MGLEQKIVIDIKSDGSVDAETFGINGSQCLADLDKLLNGLAQTVETTDKAERFKEARITTNNQTNYRK